MIVDADVTVCSVVCIPVSVRFDYILLEVTVVYTVIESIVD